MNLDKGRPDVLMAQIQHIQAVRGFKQMKMHNIHPRQVPILMMLRENEGISQRELAQELHVKPPTIAVSVKRLSASGLILKEEDAKDARISHLYLTDKAKDVMDATQNTIDNAADKMLEGFSKEEKDQFINYLKRILNNLRADDIEKCQEKCDGVGFELYDKGE